MPSRAKNYASRPVEDYDHGANMTEDEVEFALAMERYMRENRRPYPDCRDVLAVIESLGYRRELAHGNEEQPRRV